MHTWYLSFLLHRQHLQIPNFTPTNLLKTPQITQKSPWNVKYMQILCSILKILHLTKYSYTGTAHGARNSYQVCICLWSHVPENHLWHTCVTKWCSSSSSTMVNMPLVTCHPYLPFHTKTSQVENRPNNRESLCVMHLKYKASIQWKSMIAISIMVVLVPVPVPVCKVVPVPVPVPSTSISTSTSYDDVCTSLQSSVPNSHEKENSFAICKNYLIQ